MRRPGHPAMTPPERPAGVPATRATALRLVQTAVYAVCLVVAVLFFRDSWLFLPTVIAAGPLNHVLLPHLFRGRGGAGPGTVPPDPPG
ncbi:hypothetical protein [Streptomyces sp. AD55]|uniref:hypothetical protein n=1 Tax=Streptomyces sp. AD55 TaxID=3242895 RepID=UPI00352814A9